MSFTSYSLYKMIHVISIVIFFSFYAKAAYSGKSLKSDKIITGVMLLIILIGGMGLVAKIGFSHGEGWPMWVKLKLVIWLIVGASGHMVLKRWPQHAVKAFWGGIGFLTLASYLANYKPF